MQVYQACRNPTFKFGGRSCKSTATKSTLICHLWHDWDEVEHGRGWQDEWKSAVNLDLLQGNGRNFKVVRLSEWCIDLDFAFGAAKHCELLIELEDKRAELPDAAERVKHGLSVSPHRLLLLHLNGRSAPAAAFSAKYIDEPDGTPVREMNLNNPAQVKKLGEYLGKYLTGEANPPAGMMHRPHVPPAKGPIKAHKKGIGYRHATDLTFPRQDSQPITLETLRKLTVDYANLRPKYDILTTNCQMYSTTIYNLLTDTDKMRVNGILASTGAFVKEFAHLWSGGLTTKAYDSL